MKTLEEFRSHRRKAYEGLFGPNALAVAGLAIMPALLFNPSTPLRVFLFLFFWFLAALAGKKNNTLITILVILGIVAFNLIVPYGRVLFSAGPLKISSGALAAGVHRAATFEALIMLSRLAIRDDLRLPGLFGSLIGESFRILALLADQKHRIARKTFISDIDRLLFELSADVPASLQTDAECSSENAGNPTNTGAVKPARTKPAGYVILVVVVILSWLPMAIIL